MSAVDWESNTSSMIRVFTFHELNDLSYLLK